MERIKKMPELLVEDTIFELLNKVDDDFFHHKKYYEHLKQNSWYRIYKVKNGDEIHFYVKPSGLWKTKHQKEYLAVLKVTRLSEITRKLPPVPERAKNYKDKRKQFFEDVVEDLKELVDDAIRNNDTEVFCTCKSATYFGYNYILTKVRSKFSTQETRFPEKKNPALRGSLCKHLHFILEDFKNPQIYAIYVDILSYYVLSLKYLEYKSDWSPFLNWKPTLQ